MTMMQHLEESIKNKVAPDLIAQGEQVGAEKEKLNTGKSMLLAGEDENKVSAYTGVAFDVVAQIKQSITH